MSNNHILNDSLLAWNSIQGSILTGGGVLNDLAIEGRDYQNEDLPHHHLINRTTRATINQWLHNNKRSYHIAGCWHRPIFAGGWQESSYHDTEAYNLQTPSLFIDMRFPIHRPIGNIKLKSSLHECNHDELRLLARQHCFAGYSYPTIHHQHHKSLPLYTRHHIIDWNYHPRFPRMRPNRWWVDVKADRTSFKEYSYIYDAYHIPIYYERWTRYDDDMMGSKYLAMRKQIMCPYTSSSSSCDSMMVVVGNRFAYVYDKKVAELDSFISYEGPKSAGCAALVDHAISIGDKNAAIGMLELIGCVGKIYSSSSSSATWMIDRSTHPWLESTSLINADMKIIIQVDDRGLCKQIIWDDEVWDVLENSFTIQELHRMFIRDGDHHAIMHRPHHSRL